MTHALRISAFLLLGLGVFPASAPAQVSELRDSVQRFSTDRDVLARRYSTPWSSVRRERMRGFLSEWNNRLQKIPYGSLEVEGRLDWVLLANAIRREQAALDLEEKRVREMTRFVPFLETIAGLLESRQAMQTVEPPRVASTLSALAVTIDSLREEGTLVAAGRDSSRATRIVALRSVSALESLRRTLRDWFGYYAGYDPLFTWWTRAPHQRADSALTGYIRLLRTQVVGQRPGADEPIIGDPIGPDALRRELEFEMIPYGPEELVAIAEREFAWSEAEMVKASRELGFGDDWKAALEMVKNTYVEPGRQPDLIRDLAREAETFVTERELVTVPPLAREVWRMEMLSPEQQKVSPFFLGGEVIRVSYPTDEMSDPDKLMSLRGNNPHFSRATVHHELIPGHHLQGFMNARYQTHRREFRTPFWTEGWALYWEMLLWDLDFPRDARDRVGMLFWRMHRSARIIFSLRFHLGTMTPQESIDFLVDRVGHERANATAEVRRSFNGSYPPLYQIAYMIGGLQFRALHAELVGSGRMTNRAFHDAILQGGTMPVELVRARLLGTQVPRDFRPSWRF